jgi:uncharacterized membrane protein YeaQ/YmgE (transglycosylase-associated protein family)
MAALRLVAGLLLLVLGRQLFWVFVAVLGFVVGMDWAAWLFPDAGAPSQLLLAVLVGVVGAVLAAFFYQLAIAAAGFLAGGRLGVALLTILAPASDQSMWLVFVLGGVIGAVVLLLIFDWALILMSSTLGASLIVQETAGRSELGGIVFIVLVVVGIAVQAGMMRRPWG